MSTRPWHVGLDARLLAHLAHRRGLRRLARLDVAAGQAPPPLERALGPLDEQHGVLAKDGGAGAASRPVGSAADGLRISTHAPASLAGFAARRQHRSSPRHCADRNSAAGASVILCRHGTGGTRDPVERRAKQLALLQAGARGVRVQGPEPLDLRPRRPLPRQRDPARRDRRHSAAAAAEARGGQARCIRIGTVRRPHRHDLSSVRLHSRSRRPLVVRRDHARDHPAPVRVDRNRRPPRPAPIGPDPRRRPAHRLSHHQCRASRICQRQVVAKAILAHRRSLRLREPRFTRRCHLRRQSEVFILLR